MKQANKKNDIKQDIEKLVLLGKKKGFLTYSEVNERLSETVDSSEEIDKILKVCIFRGKERPKKSCKVENCPVELL